MKRRNVEAPLSTSAFIFLNSLLSPKSIFKRQVFKSALSLLGTVQHTLRMCKKAMLLHGTKCGSFSIRTKKPMCGFQNHGMLRFLIVKQSGKSKNCKMTRFSRLQKCYIPTFSFADCSMATLSEKMKRTQKLYCITMT